MLMFDLQHLFHFFFLQENFRYVLILINYSMDIFSLCGFFCGVYFFVVFFLYIYISHYKAFDLIFI